MIGRWPSGNHFIVSVCILDAIDHFLAILASPLRQLPFPFVSGFHRSCFTLVSPPPSEGPGVVRDTLGENHPRPRVSPSPSLSVHTQGERAGDTGAGLAETGDVSSIPPISAIPCSCQSVSLARSALSARPGLPVTAS